MGGAKLKPQIKGGGYTCLVTAFCIHFQNLHFIYIEIYLRFFSESCGFVTIWPKSALTEKFHLRPIL